MGYFDMIKKRCIRCRRVLRDDGTCQNERCSRYTAPKAEETESTTTEEDTSTKESKGSSTEG